MNTRKIDRIVIVFLWLSLCLMVATGFLLAYRLPPGSRGGGGLMAWGWSRHEWGDLHMWNSYVFLGLSLFHLAIHWRWFSYMASSRFKFLILAGLIGGMLAVASVWIIPVKRDPGQEHGRGQGQGGHNGYFNNFEPGSAQ
jgi:hypothetical protein